MNNVDRLRQSFLIFGVAYGLQGEPTDARLVRLHDGLTIAHFGKSWDPREVIAEATHDARVFTGRVKVGSPLMALLAAALLVLAAVSPGAAIERHHHHGHHQKDHQVGPPTDKENGVIPVSVAEHEVQASWQWYVGWANYLEAGPFVSVQACLVALRRFPQRFTCVAVRD